MGALAVMPLGWKGSLQQRKARRKSMCERMAEQETAIRLEQQQRLSSLLDQDIVGVAQLRWTGPLHPGERPLLRHPGTRAQRPAGTAGD